MDPLERGAEAPDWFYVPGVPAIQEVQKASLEGCQYVENRFELCLCDRRGLDLMIYTLIPSA
jgi:hypothetical protein